MLEAKQKIEADAEEDKRKAQQSALAKHRQAFASDAEVTFMHKISCKIFFMPSSGACVCGCSVKNAADGYLTVN